MSLLRKLPKLVSKDISFGYAMMIQTRGAAGGGGGGGPKKTGKGAAAGKPKKVHTKIISMCPSLKMSRKTPINKTC